MTHLFERLMAAAEVLEPVQSQYRVLFELPDNDGPAGILIPDPNWMAAAMAGGVLPPINTYLSDLSRMYAWLAAQPDDEERMKFSWDKIGGATHPYAEPIGPMTEEQAIEYLIQKDLPLSVWADHEKANRPRFKIIRTEMVPTDRNFRNAWRIAA